MSTSLRFTGAGSTNTLSIRLANAIQPTTGDLLEVAATQQSKILARTERGVDFEGKPFAAYSRRSAYYYYPAGAVGRTRSRAQASSAKSRLLRSLKASSSREGRRTKSGLGLRFSSYAAFKLSFLGRQNVDLRGPRAPHMLQEIVIQAGAVRVSGSGKTSGFDNAAKATRASLGIYGAAGARASGHNEGTRRLPRRRFFDMSEKDITDAAELLADRAVQRIQKALNT